jgi:hypothetical protein
LGQRRFSLRRDSRISCFVWVILESSVNFHFTYLIFTCYIRSMFYFVEVTLWYQRDMQVVGLFRSPLFVHDRDFMHDCHKFFVLRSRCLPSPISSRNDCTVMPTNVKPLANLKGLRSSRPSNRITRIHHAQLLVEKSRKSPQVQPDKERPNHLNAECSLK